MAILKALPKRPDDGNAKNSTLYRWLDVVQGLIKSDVYTPTLTDVTNLDGSTAFQCQYMRVGDVVTVSGKFNANPTAAAATELGISLPIPSNFALEEQCGGTAFCEAVQQGAAINADATNNRAKAEWLANDTGNRTFAFSFTYRLI